MWFSWCHLWLAFQAILHCPQIHSHFEQHCGHSAGKALVGGPMAPLGCLLLVSYWGFFKQIKWDNTSERAWRGWKLHIWVGQVRGRTWEERDKAASRWCSEPTHITWALLAEGWLRGMVKYKDPKAKMKQDQHKEKYFLAGPWSGWVILKVLFNESEQWIPTLQNHKVCLWNSSYHEDPLGNEMATHSSVLAWRIPGTGEPGGLQSMASHRVGHYWSELAAAAAATMKIPWGRKWQPPPAFCLGNPRDWGAWRATVHGVTKELDMTEWLNNNNNKFCVSHWPNA